MTKKEKEQLYQLINGNKQENDRNFNKMHEVILTVTRETSAALNERIGIFSSDTEKNFKKISEENNRHFEKMSEENKAIAVNVAEGITESVNKHTSTKIDKAVVDIKNTINSQDDNIFDAIEIGLVAIVSAVIAFFAHLWMHAQADAGTRFVKPDYSKFVAGATDDAGNVLSYVNPMVPDHMKIWIWTILIAVFIFVMYCLIRVLLHKKEG